MSTRSSAEGSIRHARKRLVLVVAVALGVSSALQWVCMIFTLAFYMSYSLVAVFVLGALAVVMPVVGAYIGAREARRLWPASESWMSRGRGGPYLSFSIRAGAITLVSQLVFFVLLMLLHLSPVWLGDAALAVAFLLSSVLGASLATIRRVDSGSPGV